MRNYAIFKLKYRLPSLIWKFDNKFKRFHLERHTPTFILCFMEIGQKQKVLTFLPKELNLKPMNNVTLRQNLFGDFHKSVGSY